MRFIILKRDFIIKFISSLLNLTSCIIAALFFIMKQDFFGVNNLFSILCWSIPLAIGLAICGDKIVNLYKKFSFRLRLLFLLFTAILISYCWYCFVYFSLHQWIYGFSFPIFYLWIISNSLQLFFIDMYLPKPILKQKKYKVILHLILFPLILVLTFVVISYTSRIHEYLSVPDKELYLIPSNFEGVFRVVYGEKYGETTLYEKGRRVLKIPYNRVLVIKPKYKDGLVDNEYYFIDSKGKRTVLNPVFDYAERFSKSAGILLDCTGSIQGALPDGSYSTESPLAIHYTDFKVLNKNTTRWSYEEEYRYYKNLDSITVALVNKCRSTQ